MSYLVFDTLLYLIIYQRYMNVLFKWLLRDINNNLKYSLDLTSIQYKRFMLYKSVFSVALFTGYIFSRPLKIYIEGNRKRKIKIAIRMKQGKWLL